MTPPFYCQQCQILSGTSLVCGNCRRFLTDGEKERLTLLWHEVVVAKGYDPAKDRYACHHCGYWFSRDEVCGDHWPMTKGAAPELRFDVGNGVCSCSGCNTSGNSHRRESMKAHPKHDLCRSCGFRLAARDGLCFWCIQKPAEERSASAADRS